VGRILHLKRGDVTNACVWFEKRGKSAVFFGRCVPIIRSLISVPRDGKDEYSVFWY
jgi:membrane protein DedA with SNARE-associated domain